MVGIVTRCRITAATTGLLIAASGVVGARAEIVTDLEGRWSGWGSIVMSGRASEQVRCVVQYATENGGVLVRQSLRCASASYRVDAEAELMISDGAVSGKWSERTYGADGGVRGRASDAGLNLTIEGNHFSAAMAVTTAGCKQSITIAPTGIDVARVSISLSKC